MFVNQSQALQQFIIHSSPQYISHLNQETNINKNYQQINFNGDNVNNGAYLNQKLNNIKNTKKQQLNEDNKCQQPNSKLGKINVHINTNHYQTHNLHINSSKSNKNNNSEILNYHKNFEDLDPWNQNDFQITEYHRHQQKQKQKSQEKWKIASKTLSNDKNKNNNNSRTFSSSYQRTLTQNKDCRQRLCSSRTISQTDNSAAFNTITTSKQQKLKWQLQMELRMKRRKKVSNFLKMRHFGCLNFDTIEKKESNISRIVSNRKYKNQSNSQGFSKDAQNTQTKNQEYNPTISPRISSCILQSQQKPYPMQHSNQKLMLNLNQQTSNMQSISLQNLYMSLKQYTHRHNLISKASKIVDEQKGMFPQSCRTSHYGSLIKVMSLNNELQSGTLIQNSAPIVGKSCLKSSVKLQNKLSQDLCSSKISTNNKNGSIHLIHLRNACTSMDPIINKNMRSRSISLTKNSYTGHSIKNKLKLLKSKNQLEKNHNGINKNKYKPAYQKECVRNVSDIITTNIRNK